MADLRIERVFDTDPETLFRMMSTPEGLAKWWGPEGMTLPEAQLDFTRLGPWFSVMKNKEGQRFKVSGQVVEIDPPNSLELTWAWHDEDDRRKDESRVRFEVDAVEGGARLTLIQTGLPSQEAVEAHDGGWTSALRKIEALFQ